MRPGRTSSPRVRAALALLGLLLFPRLALAAEPAPVFPRSEPPPHSHTRAYVAFAAGAALTLTSFGLQRSADRAYNRYLDSTDPADIAANYDEARRLDRWSSGALLAGTGALALGVYWRFIHRHEPARGARLGLEPVVAPDHAGLALALRWP
jgi:hypothetical protein